MNEEPKESPDVCAGPEPERQETIEELREQVARLNRHMQRLSEIGLALSAQQDRNRLLEMIV